MPYDLHHKKLGIKAIGTVESNLRYDAINYNDPITVGVAQWYGPRAASILVRMRDENPSSWTGVAGSIANHLQTQAPGSSWWTSRYLTRDEGESLRPVLLANKPIQNAQFIDDLDGYMETAERLGMDIQNNTLAALFFATMEHQGPRYARQVLATAGASTSLDRIHAVALNHPVLGRYRNRQNTVKAILLAGDVSGIDDPAGTPGPPPEDGGDQRGGGEERPHGEVTRVTVWGDMLMLHNASGSITKAVPAGPGVFLTGQKPDAGSEVPDPPDTGEPPDTPPSAGLSQKQQAIRDFMHSQIGRFKYGQGPTRLTPERNMYTDCSAVLHWAFKKVLGITIGTWTGNQYNNGTNVKTGSGTFTDAGMQVGDLIFYDWRSNGHTAAFDHVEMYYGPGQVIGHGGPGSGPIIRSISIGNNALRWRVQRVIK